MSSLHIPILLETIVESLLQPFYLDSSESWFLDCTFGGGGHTAAMLERFEGVPQLKKNRVIALDRDLEAIEKGRERFAAPIRQGRLELYHMPFGEARKWVLERPVRGLLADLGFSSDQIESDSRGFSFQRSGAIDMRFDYTQGASCYEYLNQVSQQDLEEVIKEFGEERYARRIAQAILRQRQQGLLPSTSKELAELIFRTVPPDARYGRIHPATRTFQALRIAVNEELVQLDLLLDRVLPEIRPGGRVAIISFHSLEDRRVKHRFKDRSLFKPITKKPIRSSDEEIHSNPRSKSAKLRLVERI
jgi:16S rRNA (cytosine1402-N4)-methyltransferase